MTEKTLRICLPDISGNDPFQEMIPAGIFPSGCRIMLPDLCRIGGDDVAGDDDVHDDGIDSAGFEVKVGVEVRIVFDLFFEGGFEFRVGVDGVDGGGTSLDADHFSFQVGKVFDAGVGGDDDDLAVFDVRFSEGHVGDAFVGDRHAVPDHVDLFLGEFHFFGGPVDRLESDFDAESLSDFFGEVDVETDDLVRLFVSESHRREAVVEADDHVFSVEDVLKGCIIFGRDEFAFDPVGIVQEKVFAEPFFGDGGGRAVGGHVVKGFLDGCSESNVVVSHADAVGFRRERFVKDDVSDRFLFRGFRRVAADASGKHRDCCHKDEA